MQTTPQKGDDIAIMTTNFGTIKILLYADLAPETVKNFKSLTSAGKYDNTIFHRVIKDFMIQGGDFEKGNGTGGYSYKGPGTYLQDEFGKGLTHIYGAVSMANAGPNTGGSQFFIVQSAAGTDWLNGKHAIFGYVYDGMDIIEKIAATETDSNDRPLESVTIEKVEISTFQ
ncbi:MAG: peptidylprolyl isomerase [Candidatus Peregrinibacteria bacterium]